MERYPTLLVIIGGDTNIPDNAPPNFIKLLSYSVASHSACLFLCFPSNEYRRRITTKIQRIPATLHPRSGFSPVSFRPPCACQQQKPASHSSSHHSTPNFEGSLERSAKGGAATSPPYFPVSRALNPAEMRIASRSGHSKHSPHQ